MADTEQDDDILSLETMLTRPKIKIDGAVYEITSPGELPLVDQYRLSDLGRKLANLRKTDGLAEEQQNQLTTTLDAICDIILAPVPAEVRATLRDPQKLSVLEVFTMLLSEDRLKLAGATVMKMINQYLGEKSFLGSSASTAETPKAG
jgi:hypothetical protein